jgi:ABC-type antimicrobial peptide transport system permease subunit
MWSLQSAVGKSLTLLGDQGQPMRCRIVGMLKRTVLQGAVIMDEAKFVQLFPQRSGYRLFLIEAKGAPESEVGTALTDAGEPFGLSLTRTTDRMAEYASVENTYLSVFAALGGLGLLMGLAGTAIIVRRQLLATTKETAVLQSLGIPIDVVQQIRATEHAFGGLAGLLIGLLSALWASVDTLAAQPIQVVMLSAVVLVSVGGIILFVVRSTVRQLLKHQSLTSALASE